MPELSEESYFWLGVALSVAMSMIGLCSICGKPAVTTCPICGRLVCSQDSDPVTHVCRSCAPKQMKPSGNRMS